MTFFLRRGRLAFAALAAIVALLPILATPTASTGGADDGTSPWVYLVVAVVLGIVAAALFVTLRHPPRFLRLALGLTDVAAFCVVAVFVVGSGFVLSGSDNTFVGNGRLSVNTSHIDVSGRTGHAYRESLTTDPRAAPTREELPAVRDLRADLGAGASTTLDVNTFVVEARQPAVGLYVVAVASVLWSAASLLLALWALRSILSRALAGQAFAAEMAGRVRLLAGAILLAGPVSQAVAHVASVRVIHAQGGSAQSVLWEISFTPFLIALLLLALSEVWRYGTHLQDDVAATI